MVNTLFKSENKKRKNKINIFYIKNSNPFIKYIKAHNLYFLYDNKCIQNQTNILEEVDYNSLDGYQQEIYNKYKKIRKAIIKYSEDEYEKAKEKEEWRSEYMTLLMRDKEKFNEGKLETLISLVKDGVLDLAEAIKRSGLTEDEFKKRLNSKE